MQSAKTKSIYTGEMTSSNSEFCTIEKQEHYQIINVLHVSTPADIIYHKSETIKSAMY